MFLLRNFILAYAPVRLTHAMNVTKNLSLAKLEPEMSFLETWMADNCERNYCEIAVDVGANLGIYTELFKRNRLKVIAIEPNYILAERLRRIFRRSSVNVFSKAITNDLACNNIMLKIPFNPNYPKRMRYYDQFASGSTNNPFSEFTNFDSFEVETSTLDSLLENCENFRILKIDVEGMELEVLRSGTKSIQQNHPLILCEVERRRGGNINEVTEYLSNFGYRCFVYLDKRLVEVDHENTSNAEFSNYIFLPQNA